MIKRPFTILCLSDLHLVPEKSGEILLASLRSSIKALIDKDVRWRPDYVVFAGDMVEAKNKSYPQVSKYIQTFIDDHDFHLDPFKIIAVPGNHDKNLPFLKKKGPFLEIGLKKEMRYNKKFIEALKNEEEFDFDIKSHYKDDFESFGDFYKDYVEGGYYHNGKMVGEYIYPESYLGADLSDVALTSGIKVFHDSKLCFLCINTEWVYMPDDYTGKDDRPHLCTPVIYSSLKSINAKYKDYTIVTVMHRNPSEFTWETRNRVEHNKPDILRYIYQYSDVILTGHEHIEKVLPPHKMENHAQLFKLGSASVGSRGSVSLPHYLAALMHIDPVEYTINICNFHNDGMGDKWETIIDENTYPLAHKGVIEGYEMISNSSSYNLGTACARINVKSFEEDDILHSIQHRFPEIEPAGYVISCFSINTDGNLATIIERCRKANGKNAFFICIESEADHTRFKELEADHTRFKELEGELYSHEDFRLEVYLKKTILREIMLFCYDPEKNLV